MGPPDTDLLRIGSGVRVRLQKYDGTELTYRAIVRRDDGKHIVVRAPWAKDEPRDLGCVVFEPGDVFTEHYWRERWYSIKQVVDRLGVLKGWYCDVARPVQVRGGAIVSADLILDLWVPPSGPPLRLDEDEFAVSPLADTPALVASARAALAELERLAADRFAGITPSRDS